MPLFPFSPKRYPFCVTIPTQWLRRLIRSPNPRPADFGHGSPMSTLAQSDALATDFTRPGVNPWLIAFTVMLATFMEVLDTSIANVALPHIAGTSPPALTKAPGCSPPISFPTPSSCR